MIVTWSDSDYDSEGEITNFVMDFSRIYVSKDEDIVYKRPYCNIWNFAHKLGEILCDCGES